MVKSKIKSTIVLGICFTTLTSTVAFGAEGIGVVKDDSVVPIAYYENKIIKKDRSVAIQVDGKWIELDVKPFIENSRTLMPLFGIVEGLEAEIDWDDEKQIIKINTEVVTVELKIDEDTAKVVRNIDGTSKKEIVKLDVKPKIVDDEIFVPGRFVVETLGAQVDWNNSLRAMIIKTVNVSEINNVENLVKDFGKKLQMVSLLAPKDIVVKSIEENYGEFVSSTLLEKWKNDPENAPGRLTSSPWPDRIEVLDTEKVSEDEYQVKGEIIEVTSIEKENGGAAAKQPITISAIKDNNRWVIDEIAIGDFEESNSIVYKNAEYSFEFNLPESWEGYTIVNDEWEGNYIKESQDDSEIGLMISIRHPKWTTENQRQDIPIMIFTIDQWNLIQKEELSVGAAPIPPKELGRNNEYVFALPARYNYEFLPGYEEVESILENDPLKPIIEKN
ncbi:copper amine oxidase N-terminal domain-containing protein [Schnuerera sp. xch1]|uniref:stalk domain-containing protein n=1 Tax=Schnuerera sp. xch1 TaxID=2874283 RepID=UPI001CBF8372|nr:stalk domain-containing protein [Schnuerera sp. xch1]MBZ2174265.1 copper amine oxidase N-terminal domain-containing protein [Schnuerera sp. xch1]